jgi:hypothetical protein
VIAGSGAIIRVMCDRPIACSLDPASLTTRRAGLLADLLRHARDRDALGDGLRLTFDPSSATLDLIARTIDAERQCCRFLRFDLTIEPDLGAFVLDLTGPPGTSEFLRDLLADSR